MNFLNFKTDNYESCVPIPDCSDCSHFNDVFNEVLYNKNAAEAVSGDAAQATYVAPGKYDEFYNFVSGGFNGQMGVYGLPSGRLLRIIPVFAQSAESGYGFSENTIPMLNTSHGFVPWDDLHHTELSQTNGEIDGRWVLEMATIHHV